MFKFSSYTPAALNSKSINELKSEYTHLRKVALARMKTIKNSEYGKHLSNRTYINLPTIPQLKKMYKSESSLKRELTSLLADEEWYLKRHTTLTQMRKDDELRFKTLKEKPYMKFLKKEDYLDFKDFMSKFKFITDLMRYDSGETAELYEEYKEQQITSEQMINYLFNKFKRGEDISLNGMSINKEDLKWNADAHRYGSTYSAPTARRTTSLKRK